jgi:hypothetical protein
MENNISIMQIINLCIGSSGAIGVFILIFKMGRLFENVISIGKTIVEMKSDIRSMNDRLTRLEVRVEERTLKVIHIERTGTEEKK